MSYHFPSQAMKLKHVYNTFFLITRLRSFNITFSWKASSVGSTVYPDLRNNAIVSKWQRLKPNGIRSLLPSRRPPPWAAVAASRAPHPHRPPRPRPLSSPAQPCAGTLSRGGGFSATPLASRSCRASPQAARSRGRELCGRRAAAPVAAKKPEGIRINYRAISRWIHSNNQFSEDSLLEKRTWERFGLERYNFKYIQMIF